MNFRDRQGCSRLPDAVCGVETERVDYTTRMDEIAEARERSGLRLDVSHYAGETPEPRETWSRYVGKSVAQYFKQGVQSPVV